MRLSSKVHLFSVSVMVIMAICVLMVGRQIINEVLHNHHSQLLISEVEKIRHAIQDSLNRSGIQAATRTAAVLEANLEQGPLQLKTGHIYLIEAPDRVIFHQHQEVGDRIEINELDDLFQQRNGTVEYDYQGTRHFAAYTTIDPFDWMVMLAIDESEMYAGETEYLIEISLVSVAILSFSMLVVVLFIRRFLRRLQTAVDFTRQIEDGDLDARIDHIPTDDEIGRLLAGLNAMSARIRARTFEQQRAEQGLRESVAKYRQLVEAANEGIWVQDESFRTTFVNKHLTNMLGYSQDEMQGHQISEFLFEEDIADHKQKMDERRQKRSGVYERRLRHKSGRAIWTLISATPMFDDKGQFHGSFAMLVDISERKEAEQQLAASEELFRTLVENSPDYIARYDLDMNRVYINPTLRELFEAPVSRILGNNPLQASPLHDPKRYMDSIRQVIETADEVRGEFAFGIHDAETHWASIRFAPVFDVDGNVESVLAISHDITSLKRAEQERQAHLHFFESLDRINLVLQEEGDIEQIMNKALDEVLDIFSCDRVYLLYPCDPGSPSWSVPLERYKPEYPGVLKMGVELPVNDYIAWEMLVLLDSDHPVRVGPGTPYQVADFLREQFNIRSFMAMALYPKIDKPWQLGIHQCSHERIWTDQEMHLFEEIGHRLADGLNNLLITRNLRESEERFRLVFENSPLPTWEEDFSSAKARLSEIEGVGGDDMEAYLTAHPEIVRECAALVRIANVNNAALVLHEADSKESLLAGLPGTFIPESYDAFRKELVAIAQNKTELRFDSVVQTLTGLRREVSVYYTVCPGYEKNLSKVFVSLIDITERKYAEERQRLGASVFASSQEGILISDAYNRIIDVNPAFTRLTGYSRDEALGRNPRFLSAGRECKEFYDEMWQSINNLGQWQGEIWNRRKTGEVFPELLSIVAVKDELGRLQHYVGSFSDISVIKQHEADLDRIAHYDVLTSVPNRRLLGDRLEQAIAHAKRHGKSLAVCYLDLDGFKPINDEFGHEAGDHMLIEISKRLQSMSRAEDTVARLGGDEFVLLWNDIGEEADCIQALERILDKVSQPMLLDGEPVSVSASIGVTLYPNDDVDAEYLLRHADHAMYSAKQLGKNRYQMFDARLERQISARIDLLAKVARGLDKGHFELYYQPKVDYVAGKVNGVEALLRWNDPILGMVGPKEFLSLIENDSLAFRMGRWVMEQVVRQARIWNDMGITLPISINVFPRHLKYRTFIDDLRNTIAMHWPQMPKHRLLVEIIETSDLEELEPIERVIKECVEMGIGFSLDDFGTGYSSLVYLQRLSIEELKIDQSFVRDMLDDPNDQAIVISVISLGKAFGLRVVAEGVETTQQARYLVECGCSIVQGYGMGRPMSVQAFQQWYEDFTDDKLELCR